MATSLSPKGSEGSEGPGSSGQLPPSFPARTLTPAQQICLGRAPRHLWSSVALLGPRSDAKPLWEMRASLGATSDPSGSHLTVRSRPLVSHDLCLGSHHNTAGSESCLSSCGHWDARIISPPVKNFSSRGTICVRGLCALNITQNGFLSAFQGVESHLHFLGPPEK